jgi:hypothetical protein
MNILTRGGALKPHGDFAAKLRIGLGGKAEPECAVIEWPNPRAVYALSDPLDQAAPNKALQQSKNCRFAQLGSLDQIHQTERLAFVAKRLQNIAGSNHSIR